MSQIHNTAWGTSLLCCSGGSSMPPSSYVLPIGVGDGDDVVALLQWRQIHAVIVLPASNWSWWRRWCCRFAPMAAVPCRHRPTCFQLELVTAMISLCSSGGGSMPSSSYLLPIGVSDGDDVVTLLQWRQLHAVVVLGRWTDIAAVASIF